MVKILCIIQTPVPSTEISIIRPFSYLEQQQEITWQLVLEEDFHPDMLNQVNIVIFQRNCHPNCIKILNMVQVAQIPIIYELDDNYFDLPEELPIGRYMRNPYVVKAFHTLLRSADIIKIGSPELVPIISQYNQRYVYHPYAVDLNIINALPRLNNPNFTIGYAATPGHSLDLEVIVPAIFQIAKIFPKIHWDFIGCLPEGIEKLPNQTYTPFIFDYATFLTELYQRDWQIGLCPIVDRAHNRCKTDNKLREYGACNIAGIYSNIPPYSLNVHHEETGLLVANSEHAWFNAMMKLIRNEALRQKISVQTRSWIERERSIPVIAKLWIELFKKVLNQ